MLSMLLILRNQQKRKQYIKDYCKKLGIENVDVALIEKNADKQSIGIEEVKLMQEKLFLKPIRSKTKAVVLEDAQFLTIEAQNALLKVLEEPPAHTLIVLSSESKEPFLLTILSRCQVIELPSDRKKITDEEKKEILLFIGSLAKISIGEHLHIAEKASKDKTQALEWIETIILILHEQMLEKLCLKSETDALPLALFRLIKSFQKLHTLLKTTNVNPRLAIENTLLSFSVL